MMCNTPEALKPAKGILIGSVLGLVAWAGIAVTVILLK